MKETQAHHRSANLELMRMMEFYQKNTKLSMTVQGDGEELFEYNLPFPATYERQNDNVYRISYIINGTFHTQRNIHYFNDILARFAMSMKVVAMYINYSDDAGIELSNFRGLKSRARTFKYKENVDVNKDNVFWAIKLFTEDCIKEGNGFVAYGLLESYAFTHFVDRAKDKSTLRAKCRSIWEWYDERDWTIPKRYDRTLEQYLEETKMTRTENMHKINADKVDKNYKKVVNLLTGLFNEPYKKKNGAWHILKIAEELSMSRNTVSKYIKEFEKATLS